MACAVTTSLWTVDNDLVTPTSMVRRDRMADAKAKQYEGWAAAGRRVIWQTA